MEAGTRGAVVLISSLLKNLFPLMSLRSRSVIGSRKLTVAQWFSAGSAHEH